MNMKSGKLIIVILLIIAGCFIFVRHFNKVFEQFKVEEVIDGDTIRLTNGNIVRYIGIDTPELRKKIDGEWKYSPKPFAEKAKKFNQELVKDRVVKIETDTQKKDDFGRILAYVYPVRRQQELKSLSWKKELSIWSKFKSLFKFTNQGYMDDRMVNTQILKKGYGIIYLRPPNLKYLDLFVKSQKEAIENKSGLWKNNLNPFLPQQAKFHIGEIITVKGKIRNIYQNDDVIILSLEEAEDFLFVIFKSNLNLFKQENFLINSLLNEEVTVYGMVKRYRSNFQIIIHHPCQIKMNQ